jgi:adenylosuccinate lyase
MQKDKEQEQLELEKKFADKYALMALSPVDGRYHDKTEELRKYFSEFALIRQRLSIEIDWLLFLDGVEDIRMKLNVRQRNALIKILESFSVENALEVKSLEKITNHDVKVVEYYLVEKMKETGIFVPNHLSHAHFGFTSEDVDNVSRALNLSYALDEVIISSIRYFRNGIQNLTNDKVSPMLAMTHGQPASPTSFEKEMQVYVKRLEPKIKLLSEFKFKVKLSGATGNYASLAIAYPEITNWPETAELFVEFLDGGQYLVVDHWTTQTDTHDSYAELFDLLKQISVIMLKFCVDMWLYISRGVIKQKPKQGEIGSSAMPHKINPIDFENAESNLKLFVALCEVFSRELPRGRLQRDLSDSSMERNFGVALGHFLIACKSMTKGISKIYVDKEAMLSELDVHPEVLAEAIQSVLRSYGNENAYAELLKLTRGEKVTLADLRKFISGCNIPADAKDRLLALEPSTYIGLAEKLATGEPVTWLEKSKQLEQA